MTLTIEDIADIINNNPYYDRIQLARAKFAKLYMYYTGDGIEEYVEHLEEFMREGTKETLVKLIKSNRDIIHRVMAPMDKIYTAKGGMLTINLPDDKKTDFSVFLSNITENTSMEDWIRTIVQFYYLCDPNAITFIEINEFGEPYPTVRCVEDIFDYLTNGRALEYVVFETSPQQRQTYISMGIVPENTPKKSAIYRVVDDNSDRIVIVDAKGTLSKPLSPDAESFGNITVVSNIVNEFGYVPAQVVSDIPGIKNKDGVQVMDSPLSVCINPLDELLTAKGMYNWAFWRTVFPREWMQKMPCPTCEGHTEIGGSPCPECEGKGYLVQLRTSDTIVVDFTKPGGEQVPTPPLGRLESPIDALQFMYDYPEWTEDKFQRTMWGVSERSGQSRKQSKEGGGDMEKTAFETQVNMQPKQDRLMLFGKWRTSVRTFIIDCCAWYIYRDAFLGSAILNGNRFGIESPDILIDRYTRLTGLPTPPPMYILDSILSELNGTMFEGNEMAYRKAELLRQVEPFVHESVGVIWADPQLPLVEKLMKKYFDEWTNTITDQMIADTPDIGGVDILRQQLLAYVTSKYVAGKQMDSLLITASGQIIKIGDQVSIVDGQEQKLEHKGQIYTVADIDGNSVTIKGGGMDAVFGYTLDNLMKASQEMVAA